MASDLSDDIGNVKLILLLVKGGVFLAKKNVERILNLDRKSIDVVLKRNVAALDKALKKKHINEKQKLVLFPEPTAPTDLKRWDISLYSYILLKLFGDKFDSGEKAAIRALRETRNELAHAASTTLTEELFLRQWERLKMVLCQLQRHLTQADQDEYNRIAHQISKVTDFHVAANELKPFAGSDEVVDEAITKTLKSLEQSMADCCNLVDTLPDTERKQVIEAMARIFVDAPTGTQEMKIKAATKLLESLQQGVSHEHNPQDDQSGLDEVLAACINFVAKIRKQGVDIVKVEKGSILLTFRCPTIAALKNISIYFANKMYEQSLIEVENALSKYVGSPVKLDMNIVLETLYLALAQIEQGSKDRSVVLTLKCKDSEGVKNAVDIFGNGQTKGALKSLSEALSRYVGEKIELHSTIDDDQLTEEMAIVDDTQFDMAKYYALIPNMASTNMVLLEKRIGDISVQQQISLCTASTSDFQRHIPDISVQRRRSLDTASTSDFQRHIPDISVQRRRSLVTASTSDFQRRILDISVQQRRSLDTASTSDFQRHIPDISVQRRRSLLTASTSDFQRHIPDISVPRLHIPDIYVPWLHIPDISLQRQRIQVTASTPDFQRHIPGYQTTSTVKPATATDIITPTCLYTIPIVKKMCKITGMAVLPPDKLVLIDEYNRSIKLVDVNSKSIISQLSHGIWNYQPWDITTTTNTEVAITMPHMQCIQFISVGNPSKSLPDQLTRTRTIKTHGKCSCLCYHQDKLVVTNAYTGRLDIMDMEGTVITQTRIDPVDSGSWFPKLLVQANSESIFVSGPKNGEINILNWQGEITGRITGIINPERLALLYDKSLLVCQLGDNALYHVSGSTINTVHLQDKHHKNTICVDNKGHILYTSDGFNIQVYKI